MTLNEIIVAALQQLRRGRDSQTIDNYRGAFTQYANMAQQDLSKAFPQYRTDTMRLQDGAFDCAALPRWCTKVIGVKMGERPLCFDAADGTGRMRIYGLSKGEENGEAAVRYRCLPKPLENATDTPELPEQLHRCIVSYVVGCDRSEGDASTQGGASIYFQLYNEQKRSLLRGGIGAPGGYRIENVKY